MKRNSKLLVLGLLTATLAYCEAGNVNGVPVSVLVTVEGTKNVNHATLSKEDVRVREDRDDRPVNAIRRLDNNATQMLLLIDDSAGGSFDSQLSDLKKFVAALPPDVEIGVGYMRNGMSQMACDFTADHAKAAATIRLAEGIGGADVSPYDSLSDAVKKWPGIQNAGSQYVRREVIMISSGIEGLGGGLPPENPYVNAGIASAQKAGVVVFAIYNPSYGHAGHSFWRASYGQNFLSQLTDETGGELYQIGLGSAVSFTPFLDEIMQRQTEQYLVTFLARAEKKAGLEPVKISSAVKGISLAAPDKIYVKAGL